MNSKSIKKNINRGNLEKLNAEVAKNAKETQRFFIIQLFSLRLSLCQSGASRQPGLQPDLQRTWKLCVEIRSLREFLEMFFYIDLIIIFLIIFKHFMKLSKFMLHYINKLS